MAGVFQGFDCLSADGIRRDQPQHQWMVLFDPSIAGDGDSVSGEDCFAAAGGQAQAHVGNVRQFF